jgi:hypothetical protein
MCSKKDPKSGIQRIGFLTITTYMLTLLCLFHEFLAKHNTVIPRPFYSPDLASRAFYLLPEFKMEEIS